MEREESEPSQEIPPAQNTQEARDTRQQQPDISYRATGESQQPESKPDLMGRNRNAAAPGAQELPAIPQNQEAREVVAPSTHPPYLETLAARYLYPAFEEVTRHLLAENEKLSEEIVVFREKKERVKAQNRKARKKYTEKKLEADPKGFREKDRLRKAQERARKQQEAQSVAE